MKTAKSLTTICFVLACLISAGAPAKEKVFTTNASVLSGDYTPTMQDHVLMVATPPEYVGYAGEQVLYINYDGFSNAAMADQSFQYVLKFYSPFNLTITRQLPAEPYTEIKILDATGPEYGIAAQDCRNQNPSDWGNVEKKPSGGISVSMFGGMIAHEAAHTFGLDHAIGSGNPPDIMLAVADEQGGAEKAFVNECITLEDWDCRSDHLKYCPADQQNSYAELMGLFGPNPNTGDTDSGSESDSDSDSGSDSDSDTDVDTDIDIDSDSDADAGNDAGEEDTERRSSLDSTRNSSGCQMADEQHSFGLTDLLVSLF